MHQTHAWGFSNAHAIQPALTSSTTIPDKKNMSLRRLFSRKSKTKDQAADSKIDVERSTDSAMSELAQSLNKEILDLGGEIKMLKHEREQLFRDIHDIMLSKCQAPEVHELPHRRAFSDPPRRMQSWATWAPDPFGIPPSEGNSPVNLVFDLPALSEEPDLFGPLFPASKEEVRDPVSDHDRVKGSPPPLEGVEVGVTDDTTERSDGYLRTPVAAPCDLSEAEEPYPALLSIPLPGAS